MRLAGHPLSPLVLAALAGITVAAAVNASSTPTTAPDEAVFRALKLNTQYNSAVRPPPDNGSSNTINVFVYLNNLVSVDSATQEITIKVWSFLHWWDARLAWKNRFNNTLENISSINLPEKLLWKPDVQFYDIVSVKRVASGDRYLKLSDTGMLELNDAYVLTTKCTLKLAYFPFDSQSCSVGILSQQEYNGHSKIRIKSTYPNDSSERFIASNNAFCIQGAPLKRGSVGGNASIRMHINFQRLPTFYMLILILPSVLLLAVSAVAFRLPPDCGERISFSITIVLSMCVFLQLAGEYTPTQSNSVSLITWYFSAAVLMTTINVLCNTFVLNCQLKAQECKACLPNRFIRALFLNRLVNWRRSQPQKVEPVDAVTSMPEITDNTEETPSSDGSEWILVARGADRVFFAAFMAFTVITGLFFMGMYVNQSVSSVCLSTGGEHVDNYAHA